MSPGRDELGIDGQEEGETEEGDDDEVDETDCDCWGGDGREGTETEHGEADCGVECLRRRLQICGWDAGVLEDDACPQPTEGGDNFCLEAREGRIYVIKKGNLVSSLHPYSLTSSQGVVAGITLLYSLLK